MRESVDQKMQLNVLYKTQDILILNVNACANKIRQTAYIVCEGASMSADKYNIPCRWDPFLSIPNEKEFKRISEGDIFLMYFPFECRGLQQAGEELAEYINKNMKEYSKIVVIGHSKAGVCVANMSRMLNRKCVLIFVSAPFEGTILTNEEEIKAKVSKVEYAVYRKYYNRHLVDLDIMPNSSFLREIADFSGVERHPCINVISECTYPRTILDLGCKYLGFRVGYKHSDGIVSVESQESLSKNYPIVGKVYINASHANSLKRLLLASKKKYIIE